MTYSSEESTDFFHKTIHLSWQKGKMYILKQLGRKKTQTQQLQLLTAFLWMQLLI